MKFASLRFFVAVALLWGGGQGLYTALRNIKPTEISMRDYLAAKPDKEWFTITGGSLDVVEMTYSERKSGGPVGEVFIPLRLPGAKESDPVSILVSSKDPAVLELATQLRNSKDQGEALILLLKAKIRLQKPAITGLVRYGINLRDKELQKLRKLNENLASDFVILEEGKEPSFGLSIVLVLVGLIVVGFMPKLWRGKSTPPPLPTQPPRV
jgi:hypothetical protein